MNWAFMDPFPLFKMQKPRHDYPQQHRTMNRTIMDHSAVQDAKALLKLSPETQNRLRDFHGSLTRSRCKSFHRIIPRSARQLTRLSCITFPRPRCRILVNTGLRNTIQLIRLSWLAFRSSKCWSRLEIIPRNTTVNEKLNKFNGRLFKDGYTKCRHV